MKRGIIIQLHCVGYIGLKIAAIARGDSPRKERRENKAGPRVIIQDRSPARQGLRRQCHVSVGVRGISAARDGIGVSRARPPQETPRHLPAVTRNFRRRCPTSSSRANFFHLRATADRLPALSLLCLPRRRCYEETRRRNSSYLNEKSHSSVFGELANPIGRIFSFVELRS